MTTLPDSPDALVAAIMAKGRAFALAALLALAKKLGPLAADAVKRAARGPDVNSLIG